VRENTIEAFVEARRLGADGVELDVRRTRDGALVVHHDAVVPGHGPICDLRVADLPAYVPLLAGALEACAGLIVNVEIKNAPTEPGFDSEGVLAASVAGSVMEQEFVSEVLISCFHLATLDAVKAAEPSIPTGWLTLSGYDQLSAVDTAVEHGHQALHPEQRSVTVELVDRAHGAGLVLTTWTADDPARIAELADLGVDGIITNDVAAAVAVLR
jgi:glycerophosphoryl diester phosphodiesterase